MEYPESFITNWFRPRGLWRLWLREAMHWCIPYGMLCSYRMREPTLSCASWIWQRDTFLGGWNVVIHSVQWHTIWDFSCLPCFKPYHSLSLSRKWTNVCKQVPENSWNAFSDRQQLCYWKMAKMWPLQNIFWCIKCMDEFTKQRQPKWTLFIDFRTQKAVDAFSGWAWSYYVPAKGTF